MTESFRWFHHFREVKTFLEPIDYFSHMADKPYSFLLDSSLPAKGIGRYSFSGKDPYLVFRSKQNRIEWMTNGKSTCKKGDPLAELRKLLSDYGPKPGERRESSVPFLGGAVGYLGYDLCRTIEKLPSRAEDDLGLPDCYFMFVDAVLIFDHLKKRTYVSASARARTVQEGKERSRALADRLESDIALAETAIQSAGDPLRRAKRKFVESGDAPLRSSGLFRSMFHERAYADLVKRAKAHILAGDLFEICISHRFESEFNGNPFDLYRELRRINPAPFAGFLNFPEVQVVSSSPERFLQVRKDGRCQSRPIKGTRPRGRTKAEDRSFRRELQTNPKDRAENLTIVDLVRNDFGKFCRFGSVKVSEPLTIEKYATLYQMVSTINGRLAGGRDRFDAIRSSFPGGSMTGAPKIEAMSIIDSLEPVRRGIYSGSIGYLDYWGNADLNIVIRTILVKNGKAYFQVGGAVMADSDPKTEYLETLAKARALARSLWNLRAGGASSSSCATGSVRIRKA